MERTVWLDSRALIVRGRVINLAQQWWKDGINGNKQMSANATETEIFLLCQFRSEGLEWFSGAAVPRKIWQGV